MQRTMQTPLELLQWLLLPHFAKATPFAHTARVNLIQTSVHQHEFLPKLSYFSLKIIKSQQCTCSSSENFFIFIFSRFCKNIWYDINLAKIYIWRRGPQRQGHNVVGHDARCRQEWAPSVAQT
jgi:hypothetical protein